MGEQELPTDVNRLRSIMSTLTDDQLDFVSARPFCATDKEAAAKIGRHPSTVSRWENKADVDEAIRLMRMDGVIVASEMFRRGLTKASRVILKQMDHKNANVAFRAAVEVKDTAMGKPTQRTEVSGRDGGDVGLAIRFVNDWRSPENDGN